MCVPLLVHSSGGIGITLNEIGILLAVVGCLMFPFALTLFPLVGTVEHSYV